MIAAGVLLALTMLLQSNPQQSAVDDKLEAGDDELPTPARDLVKWNHYEGKFFSIRVGAGLLYEYAAYAQNEASIRLHAQFGFEKVALLKEVGFKFNRWLDVVYVVGCCVDSLCKMRTEVAATNRRRKRPMA